MSLEYFKYQPGFRDAYFYTEGGKPIRMDYGSALNWDLSVLGYAYWKNRVHMDMDYSPQVRHVGWRWEAGVRSPWKKLPVDLFHQHHSRHDLDHKNARGDKFPVQDSYGVRFRFLEGGKPSA